MTAKRLLTAVARHLRRSLPHGVISWRYLLPRQPAAVRIHRQLWLLGRPSRLPLPLFLLLELILWLRWVGYACWRQCWRAVRQRGADIRAREGIGMARQLWRLLALGLGHCIPPGEACAFALYRPGTAMAVWDHVFVHEASAFHRWRSAGLPDHVTSQELIRDKVRLATELSEYGIPMAPTLVLVPRAAPYDPAPALQTAPRLFCKPRHGSASRDAFVIEQGGSDRQPMIFAVVNGLKMQPATLGALRAAMAEDDFLVQPLLANHPDLAPLSAGNDAVTVRIITEHDPAGMRCSHAVLEVPGHAAAGGHHTILPIDLAAGTVLPFPAERLSSRGGAEHDAIIARIGHRPLPHWEEIRTSALAAHRFLPGLFAIAWDYVVTPAGPVMLEGNSGWGTTVPQVLTGGLLRTRLREQ